MSCSVTFDAPLVTTFRVRSAAVVSAASAVRFTTNFAITSPPWFHSEHDDPQRGGQSPYVDQEERPCRQRREDENRAGCETRVHKRHHKQAPSTVVHPHQEHPVRSQL